MPIYRELEFRTSSLDHAHAIWDRIDAIEGVAVFHFHKRELGFMERARLFVPELIVRLLVEVDPASERAGEQASALLRDPYRMPFQEAVRVLAPELGGILAEIDASHREISTAHLWFETRAYGEHLDHFAAEILAAAGDEALVEHELRAVDGLVERGGVLTMRLRGSIDLIHRIAADVRRSGLVDPERLRLSYR